MIKIFNDDLTVAAFSGFVATLIKNCVSVCFFLSGIKTHIYWQLAASVFISQISTLTVNGIIVGFFADAALASFLGIIIFYVLRLTGKKHYIFKGLLGGLYIWLGITGLISRFGISQVKSYSWSEALGFLITDCLFSLLTILLIIYFGKELLPETQYPGSEEK
ncbi:MAG TPA: hypothetical protein PLZ08_08130 [Bacillota bacterium]|nr:hypothetical protein [Bacillota bacterium]HOL10152.1 hypothetical protein [Bacillota bacterium]HPO97913.1 hypothetical protein [Bacillota bacterium]